MRSTGLLVALLAGGLLPAQAEPTSAAQLNTAAGVLLFPATGTLWDEEAEAVAERLGLPVESRAPDDASYRLYPPENARLFGCRPHSVSLSARDGQPVALNIIFANKADSVGQFIRTAPGERAPPATKTFRDYRKAIAAGDEALEAVLEVDNWAQWKDSLRGARRAARQLARGADEGYVCLITGFNSETGEIALSDSWGPDYEERWITEEEAAAISQGSMAVVAW